jgi:hypothetical protein
MGHHTCRGKRRIHAQHAAVTPHTSDSEAGAARWPQAPETTQPQRTSLGPPAGTSCVPLGGHQGRLHRPLLLAVLARAPDMLHCRCQCSIGRLNATPSLLLLPVCQRYAAGPHCCCCCCCQCAGATPLGHTAAAAAAAAGGGHDMQYRAATAQSCTELMQAVARLRRLQPCAVYSTPHLHQSCQVPLGSPRRSCCALHAAARGLLTQLRATPFMRWMNLSQGTW